MPSKSSSALRRGLVAELDRLGAVRSPAVRRAFLQVPREQFVPEIAARDGMARVYANEALVTRTLPGGQPTSSSSQPTIMAEMLERLALRPGHRVLEIGAGTGYNAALLATLVGPSGSVTSVDLDWDLAQKANAALRAGGFDVEVLVGDGQRGRHGRAPYDRIIVAASSDHVPHVWFDQLAPGGLVEVPMRIGAPGPWEQLVVTFQRVDDHLRSVAVVWGGFMNLRSVENPAGGARPPQLTVSDLIDGRHHMHGHLVGPGLATMTIAARRRLAGLLLAKPRTRAQAVQGPNQSVLPYLAVAQPRSGLPVAYIADAGRGMGFAARDGSGLAVLVVTKDDRCWVWSYGANPPARLLMQEVAEWQSNARPSLDHWSISIWFTRPSASLMPARVLRRDECWITIDWTRTSATSDEGGLR